MKISRLPDVKNSVGASGKFPRAHILSCIVIHIAFGSTQVRFLGETERKRTGERASERIVKILRDVLEKGEIFRRFFSTSLQSLVEVFSR